MTDPRYHPSRSLSENSDDCWKKQGYKRKQMPAWGKRCVSHKRKMILEGLDTGWDRRKRKDTLSLLKLENSSLPVTIFPRLSFTSVILINLWQALSSLSHQSKKAILLPSRKPDSALTEKINCGIKDPPFHRQLPPSLLFAHNLLISCLSNCLISSSVVSNYISIDAQTTCLYVLIIILYANVS